MPEACTYSFVRAQFMDDGVENDLDVVHSRGSPICLLPTELLIVILDMVRKEDAHLFPRVPIIASHVSRYWRDLSLNNSVWWSNILITPPWQTDAIRVFLERSQQSLLSLRLHINFPPHLGYEELRDVLSPHFHRCRLFHLSGVQDSNIHVADHICELLQDSAMSSLEELLYDGEDNGEDVYFKSSPFLKPLVAPKLAVMRLGGIGLLFEIPTSVTTLHLSAVTRSMSFQDFAKIIESCPRLNSLAVYDDIFSNNPWPGTSSCDAPLLRSLHIFGNVITVPELLLFLSAPKLQELIIAPVVDSDLARLLRREIQHNKSKFSALRSLTLAPAHRHVSTALTTASECFPSIELLILPNIHLSLFEDAFLEDAAIFPNLQGLALSGFTRAFADSLETIVSHRTRFAAKPLRKIYMDRAGILRMRTLGVTNELVGVELEEADLWEAQRQTAMYSHDRERFVAVAELSDP